MSLKEVLEFANKNQVCFVSTVEGDQPRVRGFLMWFANEDGFYFHTGDTKKIYGQLESNPKIEVCFYDQTAMNGQGKMLRVSGEVKFVEDEALKERLLEERPFLKALVTGNQGPRLIVFCIHAGEARFWTMADNLRENEIVPVPFGKKALELTES